MFAIGFILLVIIYILYDEHNYRRTSIPPKKVYKPMYKGQLRRFKRDGSDDSFFVIDPVDAKMILVDENQKVYEDAEDGIWELV